MSLALIATGRDMNPWAEAIRNLAPEIEVEIYPDIFNPAGVKGAMLWNQPAGVLQQFPNLQWVSSIGAGVEHILGDPFCLNMYKLAELSINTFNWECPGL